jgi:hypothetical protein
VSPSYKTKGKTIGLLTCFLDNCGACLQAYALQSVIQSLGYDVQIIKYTEPGGYYDTTLKNSIRSGEMWGRIA